jgi:phospholipid/cholesterol/gamma-HCH transport system permease protein
VTTTPSSDDENSAAPAATAEGDERPALTGGAAAPAHHHESAAEEAAQAIEEAGETTFRLIGAAFVTVIGYLGEVVALFAQSLRELFRRGVNPSDLVRQMAIIGTESIPIALLTVGFSGAVLALYTASTLKDFGATDLVGGIVALSIVRETGPILTGVSVAARAGSAITAELSSMKVTEQIDALRAMAVPPIHYLVLPRVLAALVMLPLVCALADAAGVFGGGLVANAYGVSWTVYENSIKALMEPDGSDIVKGLLKTLFFGAIVALVGCREGLETEGGASGVGRSTTRSVVIAIVLVFAADLVLSFLLIQGGGLLAT